jgi:hypothetical protein
MLKLFCLPCGGAAQWTTHPPQEQKDPGSNPARALDFRGNVAIGLRLNDYITMLCLCVGKREMKALAQKFLPSCELA